MEARTFSHISDTTSFSNTRTRSDYTVTWKFDEVIAQRHQCFLQRLSSSFRGSKILHTTILIAVACGLAGCRGGVNTELLERDLRLQEDRIYQLEDHLAESQAILDTYQQENADLRKKLGLEGSDASSSTSRAKATERKKIFNRPTPAKAPSSEDSDTIPEIDTDLTPPKIESKPPSVGKPTPSPPSGTSTSINSTAGIQQTTLRTVYPRLTQLPMPDRSQLATPAERVVLHRMLIPTAPPAPHGTTLRVLLEPRTQSGQLANIGGSVALMVIDPSHNDASGRLARWDFPENEVAEQWRKSTLGTGLHFDVPLPPTLQEKTYELWARVVTPNGDKLLARVEFEFSPASEATIETVMSSTSDSNGKRYANAPGQSQTVDALEAPAWPSVKAYGSADQNDLATSTRLPEADSRERAADGAEAQTRNDSQAERVAAKSSQIVDEQGASPEASQRSDWSPFR